MKLPLLITATTLALLAPLTPYAAANPTPPPTQNASPQSGTAELQHDADLIRAVGVIGVQARVTSSSGRSRTVVSGVADLATQAPVPPGGVFRIGSTNKTLVATVVLQLVAEHRLRLDDSVEKWLPGFVRGNGYDSRRITVRHLLQHTAGIYDGNFPTIETRPQYYERRFLVHTEEAIVRAGLSHPPEFQPGEKWDYSNTGYDLIGLIIKAVTGRTWYAEVDRRIVRPLGMTATSFPRSNPRIDGPHAKGYTRFAAGEPYTDTTELIDADASGGYLSTLADLDRFQRALFGGRLLKPAQLREMTRTVPVDAQTTEFWPGARYGLGIFSRTLPCGGTVWIPGGDQLGYRTRLAVTRDGRRSAVVTMSTQLYDSLPLIIRQETTARTLLDHTLCHHHA